MNSYDVLLATVQAAKEFEEGLGPLTPDDMYAMLCNALAEIEYAE